MWEIRYEWCDPYQDEWIAPDTRLAVALGEGWEPFAVSSEPSRRGNVVWLRRKRERDG